PPRGHEGSNPSLSACSLERDEQLVCSTAWKAVCCKAWGSIPPRSVHLCLWKSGRVVEGGGLENRWHPRGCSWVRLPPLPPRWLEQWPSGEGSGLLSRRRDSVRGFESLLLRSLPRDATGSQPACLAGERGSSPLRGACFDGSASIAQMEERLVE